MKNQKVGVTPAFFVGGVSLPHGVWYKIVSSFTENGTPWASSPTVIDKKGA